MRCVSVVSLCCLALSVGCRCSQTGTRVAETQSASTVTPREKRVLPVCERNGLLPLDAAREAFDAEEYEKALACAAQASALSPSDALAHTERANALAQLGRDEEASLAYARALAVSPESLEVLAGAAHFYVVLLPSRREFDELGTVYAERGFELALHQNDEVAAVNFARLSAMGLNDTGQSSEALERAEWVLAREPRDSEAQYERAVALFELCRFDLARQSFELVSQDAERAAWAHHYLGLLAERAGQLSDADTHFEQAHALDAEAFPAPVSIAPPVFVDELNKAIAALPEDMRIDLQGVPVEVEDLPKEDDLVAGELPLSPTILGLFRGTPLGQQCGGAEVSPCRSIALYRKNLARAVKTEAELVEQIRVTLLHEIGHLRGEDDAELAARGLE